MGPDLHGPGFTWARIYMGLGTSMTASGQIRIGAQRHSYAGRCMERWTFKGWIGGLAIAWPLKHVGRPSPKAGQPYRSPARGAWLD